MVLKLKGKVVSSTACMCAVQSCELCNASFLTARNLPLLLVKQLCEWVEAPLQQQLKKARACMAVVLIDLDVRSAVFASYPATTMLRQVIHRLLLPEISLASSQALCSTSASHLFQSCSWACGRSLHTSAAAQDEQQEHREPGQGRAGQHGEQASSAAGSAQEGSSQAPVNPASSSEAEQQQEPQQQTRMATGPRRVIRGGIAQPGQQQLGIVHISNTMNNIILALSDLNGNVKATTSAGTVGFRNARKSLPLAAERAADELARKALKLGYGTVEVKMKGAGANKQAAVTALHAAGLRITQLADITPVAYNGCRLRARRRV